MTYVISVSHHSLCTSGPHSGLSKHWVRCKFPHTIVLHPHHLPGAFPPAASHPASAESGKITPSPCRPVKEPHPGPGQRKSRSPQTTAFSRRQSRSSSIVYSQRLPRGPSCCMQFRECPDQIWSLGSAGSRRGKLGRERQAGRGKGVETEHAKTSASGHKNQASGASSEGAGGFCSPSTIPTTVSSNLESLGSLSSWSLA